MRTWFRVSKFLALLLGLMLAASPVSADWYRDYEKGLDAINQGRYQEGIRLLGRALEEHPKTGRVRSGMFIRDYYPYLHMGRAYKALGRIDDAIVAFQHSKHPDAADELAKIRTTSITTTIPSTTTTTVPVKEITRSTTSTIRPPHSTTTVRPPATSIPQKTTPNEEVARLLRMARDRFERGDIGGAAKAIAEAAALDPHDADVAVVRAELKKAAVGQARQAALLFGQGNSKGAIPILEDALTALPESAGGHMLLGWLYYSSYLASGDPGSSLAERAQEQLRKALELDPNIKPDGWISPRLVKLFHRVRRDAQ